MRTLPLALLALLPAAVLAPARAERKATPFPSFEAREIDKSLSVGYAVVLADVDGDGKKDIVVVDTRRVVWYQNPTWKRRTLIEGKTEPDNVCIAAHDVDGDGKVDFALGAGWRPFNTKSGGTLQWLRRGKSLDEPWKLFPIAEEPTLHRIRFADLDGSGKPALLVAPLMGRNSSAKNNWMDGSPVRLLAFRIPKDPARDRWVPEVIDQGLHVVHNFCPIPAGFGKGKGMDVLTASYDGVHLLTRSGGKWTRHKLGTGNQDNPKDRRGASEVKLGWLKSGRDRRPFIATVEPWHGHQVVVYTPGKDLKGPWHRQVIDDKLRWGHGVWCADLDGDGSDELIVGVRDNLSNKPGERCGVRVYQCVDGKGVKWARHLLDEGGVAVEDLTAGDLGDGRVDIVAVGRATKNVRIYRNVGKK